MASPTQQNSTWIGANQYNDTNGWSYCAYGEKWHNGHSNLFGKDVQSGDTLKVIVDRKVGSMKVIINGEDFGEAYQDDKMKTGEYHFGITVYQEGEKIQILDE